jgi:RND family efflux transporter MFP subunit
MKIYSSPALTKLGLGACLALGACKPGGAGQADAGAQMAPVSVTTTDVALVEVPTVLHLTGTLRGDRETDLAANAAGRVTATRVERGAQVTSGQVLAQLDVRAAALSAREATAQAESMRAQEAQAKVDCQRYEALKDKGAISAAEYERIAIQCRTMPLSVEAASARASLAAQNVGDGAVRAPFAGVVTERYVEVGQYVRQDSRVVTIVSLDPLRLELAVPEAEVAQVKEGAEVTFRVAAYPDKKFKGSVRFVSGALRAQTRDLVVEALVPNPDKLLKPGMFADVELATGSRKLPGVPKASVLERDGKPHAFFVVDDRLEERVLSPGPESGIVLSVTKGATVGDKIVTTDPAKLVNGARVR